MTPTFASHEIVKWEHSKVDIKLNTTDGTSIVCGGCRLILTNQNIHVMAQSPTTYHVPGRGDRTFNSVSIPLLIAAPHRFIQPWFGPYKWETVIKGRLPGNLEPRNSAWKLLLIFSEGGAFDYRRVFLQEFASAAQAAQQGMEETLPAYTEI